MPLMNTPRAPMAMQTSDALQQNIHRAKIRDQQICAKIQRLLKCLGADYDAPARRAFLANGTFDGAI